MELLAAARTEVGCGCSKSLRLCSPDTGWDVASRESMLNLQETVSWGHRSTGSEGSGGGQWGWLSPPARLSSVPASPR